MAGCNVYCHPGSIFAAQADALAADYVYSMEFDGDRVRHMTRVWNDGHGHSQLGWA